ncbi:HAD family hydrolase [Anditalea andensis]|nr:HAD family phosphatase [Anditalea andensis]
MATTNKYKAFIFDMNGTLIDDMKYHTDAWYEILTKELGSDLSYENLKAEMYGKNAELLVRVFGEDYFQPEEIEQHSVNKEKQYQKIYKPHLEAISGLQDFLSKAEKNNIAMGIGSAAIMFNVDFVLDNLDLRRYFASLISADEVERSKPDPETFLKGAEALGVKPEECLVFEDAPKGVEAARNAGMDAVVLTTMHGKEEFAALDNIKFFIKDYEDPQLDQLI